MHASLDYRSYLTSSSVSAGMGGRVSACCQALGSTQPGHPFVGGRNEYAGIMGRSDVVLGIGHRHIISTYRFTGLRLAYSSRLLLRGHGNIYQCAYRTISHTHAEHTHTYKLLSNAAHLAVWPVVRPALASLLPWVRHRNALDDRALHCLLFVMRPPSGRRLATSGRTSFPL